MDDAEAPDFPTILTRTVSDIKRDALLGRASPLEILAVAILESVSWPEGFSGYSSNGGVALREKKA